MPGRMSEYMSDKMLTECHNIYIRIIIYISDRMPERMSEYMSDRMSLGGVHSKKVIYLISFANPRLT